MMSKNLFFLGAGRMATAIAGGMIRSGSFEAKQLAACDASPTAADRFEKATGVTCWTENYLEILEAADAVVLAVKPQQLRDLLASHWEKLSGKLLISIAAGIPLQTLTAANARAIRVMPNTPALAGAGAAAFTASSGATAEDRELVKTMFEAVGTAVELDEKYFDAVTGLSGSGPAYVFLFINALADGGVAEGLPRDIALRLATQTVLGSAKLLLESGAHPAELKDQVTSPGGTTAAGLEALEDRAFTGTVLRAVRAAAARSRELAK